MSYIDLKCIRIIPGHPGDELAIYYWSVLFLQTSFCSVENGNFGDVRNSSEPFAVCIGKTCSLEQVLAQKSG